MLTFIRLSLFSLLLSGSLSIDSSISDMIMNDMESALNAVTNESREVIREKIIPKLYNLIHGSCFLFKIPLKDSKLGYKMISVQRKDMMTPIFPNITLNQREKTMKNQSFNVEDKRIVKEDANTWSSLGLDGWEGELADPNGSSEVKHKDNATHENSTILELPIEAATEVGFTDNLPHQNRSENVYIARANDPFGMSTKWIFRNEVERYPNDQRTKRSVPELYSMIKCATGCQPLIYQGYGCFCGYQGDGIPIDGIDRCCKAHDKCYGNTNCPEYINYLAPYLWKCYYGKPICAVDHGFLGGPNSCAVSLCKCDRTFAMCLRRFQCPRSKAVCTTSILRALQNIFF